MKIERNEYSDRVSKKDKLKFYWEETEDIFIGENIVEEDHSISFCPNIDIGSFGLYLIDWFIEIPTGTIGKNIFRYLGGYFFQEKMLEKDLCIPNSVKGRIYFETEVELGDGAYYSEFFPFKQNIYYDKKTNWFAVGDIFATGAAIEFATNNIAIIDSKKNLVVVYAKLKNPTKFNCEF